MFYVTQGVRVLVLWAPKDCHVQFCFDDISGLERPFPIPPPFERFCEAPVSVQPEWIGLSIPAELLPPGLTVSGTIAVSSSSTFAEHCSLKTLASYREGN
jgi:hypothetical protein